MKVIGLVSGGKDSVYNLLQCQKYGHEVVALANLLPCEESVDELDSYMYQTVGHQLIEAYALCAGLPLFRRRIHGSSRHKELEYCATEGDEVEDLLSLLAFAKERMPEIEAVSSGAIASDYQRLRVENVCSRLGLVSLGYLWLRPQAGLLQGMIDSGIEAVLVKVAALGLEPHRDLGKSLQQMQPLLSQLNRRFGCNICGEGGEYETLTLDCPLFTESRIVLDSWEVILHSRDTFASVGVLHPAAFHTVPKPSAQCGAGVTIGARAETVRHPNNETSDCRLPSVDSKGCGVGAVVIDVPLHFSPTTTAAAPGSAQGDGSGSDIHAEAQIRRSGDLVTAHFAPSGGAGQHGDATALALRIALAAIEKGLAGFGCKLRDAALVQLWLRDMAHFSSVNAEYSLHFPTTKPAARACVALPLPPDVPLCVQVIVATAGRKVLHVQSISEWAPSCIGPYSQAVSTAGLLFLAGQIGLQPATMQLLPGLQDQVNQCFDSCQAVATALKVHLSSSMLGVTLYSTPGVGGAGRKALHEGLLGVLQPGAGEGGRKGDSGAPRDPYLVVEAQQRQWRPMETHLVVSALPREAAVEVQPLCCAADRDDCLSWSDNGGRNWREMLLNQDSETGDVTVRCLRSAGCFCLCQAALKSSRVGGIQGSERPPALPHSALSQLARAVIGSLEAASLSCADVVTLQLFLSREVNGGAKEVHSVESEMRAEIVASGFAEGLPLAVIPVEAVGLGPEADSLLQFEMLAWKAER